ncbi:MAG: phosphonate ABC transporter, permease protein PhnE [Spirochaetes bacterium]|nr:MAG: phosphonate ABC transporter, permease protein PhnE [Spirochaetota bacterium]
MRRSKVSDTGASTVWKRDHFIKNPILRWIVILVGSAYLIYAINDMNFNLDRMRTGWPRAVDFFQRMFPPDYSRWTMIYKGVFESLQMAIIATTVSIFLAIPLSLAAAANISVKFVYVIARAFIVLARSFPPILVAIMFVKAFGFGPFPGILTLSFTALGFMGKLLAEAIENIDKGQVEAVRATGANWFKVQLYGVAPQVLPRYVGLSIYLLDINLRASTIIGIVGAGGIGGALFNAFHRYEYDTALAILIAIIVIVLVMEFISSKVRSRLQ